MSNVLQKAKKLQNSPEMIRIMDYLKRFYPKPNVSADAARLMKLAQSPYCPVHPDACLHLRIKVRRNRAEKLFLVMGMVCHICGDSKPYINAEMTEANEKASGDYDHV